MSQVALRINGRAYEITCEDGQEDHLREVGAYFDSRVRELAEAVGQVGEGRLLVIAGLLVADELFEAKEQLRKRPAGSEDETQETIETPETIETIETIEQAAARIDALARRLEQA